MSTWQDWLDAWEVYAKTSAFSRKLERAVEIAKDGAAKGNMFAAISGGKDSIAVAAVIAEAGLNDIPCVHCYTDLNTPGMDTVAIEACKLLDLGLEIVEPDGDVWDFLRCLPKDQSILDKRMHVALRNFCSSGNMLIAYEYEHGYVGSISGMRADESKGRAANRRFRGPLYQIKVDGTWMCLPIVDWTARDVFAAAVEFDLPIHDHYRRLMEQFDVSPESPASRVDSLLVEDSVVARGGLVHARVLYPETWRKIVEARPELNKESY